MLSSAGLVLRKWASNCNELTNLIQEDLRLPNASLSIDDDTVKTLGILWHPASDVFCSKLYLEGTLTKRKLLSTIAKTFDTLGWLSPITIQSKLFMQKLWKYQLQWDEVVPPDIAIEWKTLSQDILFVKDFKISRYLFLDPDNQFQLHGFSVASEKAYAAVIYCHTVSNTGQITVQLVIAKTKVAPLKTISLPRLELCGVLLLSNLMDLTCKAFDIPISQPHFHTDSTIVLAWIGSHASRWKTFMSNRVAKIQTLSSTQWHHVSGNENPADLATRGVSSSALLTSLWFCGPTFLYNTCSFHPESSVPTSNDSVSTLNDPVPEKKCCVQLTIAANHLPNSNDLIPKYSSLSKLKRVTAYCLRFVNNCRNSKDKVTGFLITSELNTAMNVLIKSVQFIEFNNEINALKRNQALSCRSKILSLNPFLDNSGILRMGGRLRHANIAYGHKHPILLPKRHILINFTVRHYHEILLHAGPQLVQSSIQEQYWIIGARDIIRYFIRKCVKYCRIRASITNQMMSDLPSSPSPTFLRCGVDYAGPFQIKASKRRNSKSFKAYIALFVCFTTRGINLELELIFLQMPSLQLLRGLYPAEANAVILATGVPITEYQQGEIPLKPPHLTSNICLEF
ncbi:reverse transcriptase [Caerostris darwini]|uniref:Reverse transcriptase n=1 Tax=Caerostris darwini TaxID=1538125 RepID=A0AAV4Q8U5_9ARAC|nr:reverse transcriptase [Caerostris darwini]